MDDKKTHNEKMSEMALDALTLLAMHLRAADAFKDAAIALRSDRDNPEKKARVIAFERLSHSIHDLSNKSINDMIALDRKFDEMVSNRWSDAVRILDSSMPMITMMVEAELADVPKMFDALMQEKDISDE